jgi:hypothetical protein
MAKTYIVINRHIIQANRKNNETNPPIRVTHGRYGKPTYTSEFVGANFRLVYDPSKPLKCGATVYLEVNEVP